MYHNNYRITWCGICGADCRLHHSSFSRLPEPFQPVDIWVVIKNNISACLDSHRTSSPSSLPACYRCSHNEYHQLVHFPSVSVFLIIVLLSGRSWGFPVATALSTCHGNTEQRVPRVQPFTAAQVVQPPGVKMCCVPWWNQRLLALSLGVPPDHLIAETLGCLLLHVSVMIFSSFSTYLLNTYTQETVTDMTRATMTLCRYSITSAAMFNRGDGE